MSCMIMEHKSRQKLSAEPKGELRADECYTRERKVFSFLAYAAGGPCAGQRQRDESLWNPFHRCGGGTVRRLSFVRAASPRQKDRGAKARQRQFLVNVK